MSERAASSPTRTRRTPPGINPETGELAAGAEIPEDRAIVFLADIQDLDRAQDELMDLQLAGEEAVSTLLYAYPEQDRGRPTGRFVVGPSADFVLQLVRQLNKASRGKMVLRLLSEPPIVQDFTAPGADGKVRAYVRVIVGVHDVVTGEVAFGIKTAPRAGTDPEGVAHTRAIRRAFEVHPLYNRKKVTQFIRRKLRSLHLDPAKFLIAGEGVGGGVWSEFFGRARLAGVPPEALRAGVREQTGQGLSQAKTPEQVAAAASAAERTLAEALRTPPALETSPAKLIASQEATGETAGEMADTTQLKLKIRDHITHLGLKPATVNTLWTQVSVSTPPSVADFRRMLTVLQLISTGTDKEQAVIQVLKEDRRGAPVADPFA